MVLVSHSKAFVFLKTRKTAGTSVEMLLQRFCVPPGHVPEEATPQLVSEHGIVGSRLGGAAPADGDAVVWKNHMPAVAIKRQLGPERWARYAKISTMRNPFDLLVSMYYWRRSQGAIVPSEDDVAGFRRFILGQRWNAGRPIVMIGNAPVVDHLIRYEHLAEDIGRTAQALDLDLNPADLPVTKRTRNDRDGRPVSAYFDDETTDAVRRKCRFAFRHFGYSDDPKDADAAPALAGG